MVCEYNSNRNRLYNSQVLLEGTNLVLYNINKGVLVSRTTEKSCKKGVGVPRTPRKVMPAEYVEDISQVSIFKIKYM